MRHAARPLLAAVAVAVLLVVSCASGDDTARRPSPSPSEPLPTLPAGRLAHRVLQPSDVDRSLVPISAQTGPADVKKIAEFSGDPAAAEKSLREHGFVDAYVVQYADPVTRGVVTNVVTSFATEAGAKADLAADLAATRGSGESVDTAGIGDEAGGVKTFLDPAGKTGELVTLRWRVGSLSYLLAVGAPSTVDQQSVRQLAELLVARVRDAASASPSPSPSAT